MESGTMGAGVAAENAKNTQTITTRWIFSLIVLIECELDTGIDTDLEKEDIR